jgi:hypothetical protein
MADFDRLRQAVAEVLASVDRFITFSPGTRFNVYEEE